MPALSEDDARPELVCKFQLLLVSGVLRRRDDEHVLAWEHGDLPLHEPVRSITKGQRTSRNRSQVEGCKRSPAQLSR